MGTKYKSGLVKIKFQSIGGQPFAFTDVTYAIFKLTSCKIAKLVGVKRYVDLFPDGLFLYVLALKKVTQHFDRETNSY